MKRVFILGTLFTLVLVLVTPFVGGGGPGLASAIASATASGVPLLASGITAPVQTVEVPAAETGPVAIATVVRIDETAMIEQAKAEAAALAVDYEHLAQKPVPKPKPVITDGGGGQSARQWYAEQGLGCPGDAGGGPGGAPGASSALGVGGTTSDDVASFAYTYNSIRVVELPRARAVRQLLLRLLHGGAAVLDGRVAQRGPDGCLGSHGLRPHRWRPEPGLRRQPCRRIRQQRRDRRIEVVELGRAPCVALQAGYVGGMGGVCIAFAMTHGGVPNEPYDFTRAAARWVWC